METALDQVDVKMRILYEASREGSVPKLKELLQQDSLILHRINSRTLFIETPLHISVLLGHLEFTKALLAQRRELALVLDSFQSTALHLASSEGYIDIVKVLLLVDDQACLVHDREGKIPLHYAVIRGRIEVVKELVRVKPESLEILDKGKTVFHLCVTYNHLEILQALVESNIDTSKLLSLSDSNGKNTILHLAVMLKQVEIVRYLLSVPKIREAISNLENSMGFTANDILQQIPQDFKSLEIQVILMNNGIKSEKKEMDTPQQAPTTIDVVDNVVRPPKKNSWRNILESMGKWFKHDDDWLEEMRGNLSLVATFISTITFQVIVNPPGGFIQQDTSNSNNSTDFGGTQDSSFMPNDVSESPGKAMLGSRYPSRFCLFIIYNTISFIASLSVALLLVSGMPLKNMVVMWMLSIGMCITVTSLALAYFNGLSLIMPTILWHSTCDIFNTFMITWIGLLGLVGVYIMVGFVIWLMKKCMRRTENRMSRYTETEMDLA